jgi:two-component system NarL family sensor kinase
VLDDFGLEPSLQWLAESFQQRTGIAVQRSIGFAGRIDHATETHLFRIAQEAFTNVARHSGATAVTLSLDRAGTHLRLTIGDNGKGFRAEGDRSGFGLLGMRERMSSTGGRLDVKSSTAGVTVTAEVPIHDVCETATHPSSAG